MESDKTPGSDSLPVELYRTFWNDISDYLLNSFNYAYPAARAAVRYSKTKNYQTYTHQKNTLKNEKTHNSWRPISLLNCEMRSF